MAKGEKNGDAGQAQFCYFSVFDWLMSEGGMNGDVVQLVGMYVL
jgi:hypothetical protein